MLEKWVLEALVDPVTKQPATPAQIGMIGSVVDARRYLKNTTGFLGWEAGQDAYESWDQRTPAEYELEIEGVRPVYEHTIMSGRILDVGGGAGIVRHFLTTSDQFVSIDPYLNYEQGLSEAKRAAYPCLSQPLNFIAACAEFVPFAAHTFDWVHMRSMLDHVHSPDMALLEARRILKKDGRLVVGLFVDGGKSGRRTPKQYLKEAARFLLTTVGFDRYKDHHTFHPTFANLQKIITDNGFVIDDVYWQPQWKDQVCYITASLPK